MQLSFAPVNRMTRSYPIEKRTRGQPRKLITWQGIKKLVIRFGWTKGLRTFLDLLQLNNKGFVLSRVTFYLDFSSMCFRNIITQG